MDIQTLQQRLKSFYEERDWSQFHNPKNLVMALCGEVGELAEVFQWLTPEQATNIMHDPYQANKVHEEMADVFVYLVSIADKLGIDLFEAAEMKMEKNRAKYPIEKSKGNSKKYSEL